MQGWMQRFVNPSLKTESLVVVPLSRDRASASDEGNPSDEEDMGISLAEPLGGPNDGMMTWQSGEAARERGENPSVVPKSRR